MLIVIIGNISSGKTTTCSILSHVLSGYKYISLDAYRRMNTDKWRPRSDAKSGMDRLKIDAEQLALELNAKNHFYAKVQSTKNCIVEATGTGKDFTNVFGKRDSTERVVIKLKCPVAECIKRSKDKIKSGYQWPALPEVYQDYSGLTGAPLIKVLENGINWMHGQLEHPHLISSNLVIDSYRTSTDNIIKEILNLNKF